MATLRTGDLWAGAADDDYIGITTNAFVTRNRRELVMGAGFAAQAKERHPELPRAFGERIIRLRRDPRDPNDLPVYGLLQHGRFFAVQVKRHFREDADPLLIAHALGMLRMLALAAREKTFHLNYPGIGNGRLDVAEVAPWVDVLPDNVHVWRLWN